MADLDKSGIVTGATTAAAMWTALYDALIGTTVYDNVKTLLGNIKEYTCHTVFVDGGNWTTTDLVNTTGASNVVIGLFDQNNQEDITIIFTGYTLPTIDKILVSTKFGSDWIGENEQVWFAPVRRTDTQLVLKMHKSDFTEFNHAGGDIGAGSDLYIRILFYP